MTTDIEWTDETWNPVVGCSLASPGCTNCYAMRMAARLARIAGASGAGEIAAGHYVGLTETSKAGPVWTGKVAFAGRTALMKPLKWKAPRCVFVNSMGDLFHEAVPDALIDSVFAVMALAPQHIFLVLTKRAARMRDYAISLCENEEHLERVCDAAVELANSPCAAHIEDVDLPLPNVWLGVSAEDQPRADGRIPHLLATPAAKRFVSAEPLLGPIDLSPWIHARGADAHGKAKRPPEGADAQSASNRAEGLNATLDWIISGGESGPGARPAHPDWLRSLRFQCDRAGAPFFLKQWGEWSPEFSAGAPKCTVFSDGVRCSGAGMITARPGDATGEFMFRVGKKRAGATLDGREHRDWPR